MGRTTEQRKQLEAIFVPNKRTHTIEFAGVVEKDTDCDIHGRRLSKRDSIAFPIGPSRRESNDPILWKRDSVDREILHRNGNGNGNGSGEGIYGSVQRRRSSSDKSDPDAQR